MNYDQDIRIDETALDVEWLEQASLALKYGKYYAECRRRVVEIEEKLKVIRAELTKESNERPKETTGKDKPTAPDVDAFIRTHDRHITAKREWVEAQFELDIAEVAKNEIGFTRKAALENLVKLHGQQYFAGPRIPHDLSAERAKADEYKISIRTRRTT